MSSNSKKESRNQSEASGSSVQQIRHIASSFPSDTSGSSSPCKKRESASQTSEQPHSTPNSRKQSLNMADPSLTSPKWASSLQHAATVPVELESYTAPNYKTDSEEELSPQPRPRKAKAHETYIQTDEQQTPLVKVIPDTGINSLPTPGSKGAPRKFDGSYSEIKDFIRHYKKLCSLKRITGDQEKIENIGQYCSKRVRTFIEGLESYYQRNWCTFSAGFLNYYDAERDEKRYKLRDLRGYTDETRDRGLSNLWQPGNNMIGDLSVLLVGYTEMVSSLNMMRIVSFGQLSLHLQD
jgi:hypothetical protein